MKAPNKYGALLHAPSQTGTTRSYHNRDGCQEYQKLPLELTQNGGHKYVQVWRDDHAAVYEQHNAIRLLGYEAITIKKQEAKSMFGKDYPAKELYPCSEDWGTLAFTTNSLEKAMAYAQSLSKRVETARQKAISSTRIRQRRTGTRVSVTKTHPPHFFPINCCKQTSPDGLLRPGRTNLEQDGDVLEQEQTQTET
jgi:hypothetical protein